jgi:hypothetical protein
MTQSAVPAEIPVVVVSCSCGMFPLEQAMQRDSRAAWTVAAKHAELNPTLCQPNMRRATAPAALAALA